MLAGARIQQGFRQWLTDMSATPWRPAAPRSVEDIRQAMMAVLGEPDSRDLQRSRVVQTRYRLRLCRDVQALWYMRSDVMRILSVRLGEVNARQSLEDISVMFDGLLPAGLNSRPAPLR
jgi:hypothetical protein